MNPTSTNPFTAEGEELVLQGDAAREAIASLRGYAYQVTAAALAWVELGDIERLYLEVAEDYAQVARDAVNAVQVKDTAASGSITLNSEIVREAIAAFVKLCADNPKAAVQLQFLTTSTIGTEKAVSDRPAGESGLAYWRKAAIGADVGPLRAILESDKFPTDVQDFVRQRDDVTLRADLLKRIHWDAGAPDLAMLQRELEDALIVVGRDKFPATEASRVAQALIFFVLQRSIQLKPADRLLRKADLYRAIDGVTHMSVPRASINMALQLSSMLAGLSGISPGGSSFVALTGPAWLIQGDTLPLDARLLDRRAVEEGIATRLRQGGIAVLFGASGLGKSTVVRAIASKAAQDYLFIDLRGATVEETRSRLSYLVARIGVQTAHTFVFEDLNHLDDPLIAVSVERAFVAMRRRDIAAIVTCYTEPSIRSLQHAQADPSCTLACPYFSKDEAEELVTRYGGDAKLWGSLAFAAGSFGHPQLVHAFILGIRSRGWPLSEVSTVIADGLSSGDVDAARDAARRTLIAALPESIRNLLYRLSLTIGGFDRATALVIAGVSPPIQQAGDCLDALIGPWIETVGSGRYRISPLAAKSGQNMLAPVDQAAVHNAIATQLVGEGSIDASDIDAIVSHALIGKNGAVLLKMAFAICDLDERTTALVADITTAFKVLRFDAPLFPSNPAVSALLRIAQFKLLTHTRDAQRVANCATALLSEVENLPPPIRQISHAMALMTVVGTIGIANYVPNWLDLLGLLQDLTESDAYLASLQRDFETKEETQSGMFGALFGIGSASMASVATLEHVIDQLDKLGDPRRSLYLKGISENTADFSVFINGAWLAEHKRSSVDALDARERYRRMAEKTAAWGIRPLHIQCWIAQAIMLDEYANDQRGALKVLDDAVRMLGDDVLLFRARAKIYSRAQDHEASLAILRKIADQVGHDSPIERAFALRDAGISAAKIGDWVQAQAWFLEAKHAAEQSAPPDMAIMAIGLTADAAVAGLHAGQVDVAVKHLVQALRRLSAVDPDSSLVAGYCHRVVRHTLLWSQAFVDRTTIHVDGAPLSIVPGCCSNMDPGKEIAKLALGHLDIAWYLLAQTAATSGIVLDGNDALDKHLAAGRIVVMEADLGVRRLARDIATLQAPDFCKHLWPYVEASATLSREGARLRSGFDVLNPPRGEFAPVSKDDIENGAFVIDPILAFVIVAVCANAFDRLPALVTALETELGRDRPWTSLVSRLSSQPTTSQTSTFEEGVIDTARRFRERHQTPQSLTAAGIRFFQQASRSNFKPQLVPRIAAWQRDAWTRILETERFHLSNPRRVVPSIEAALRIPENDKHFVGKILLAAAGATALTLPPSVVELLQTSAGGAAYG